MASNNVKVEEIFGGVSDFHGAFGTGEKKQETAPVCPKGRTPHWHDSCFDGTGVNHETVTEAELSSHF